MPASYLPFRFIILNFNSIITCINNYNINVNGNLLYDEKFADSSVGIDILKLYMEDDQLKLHQSHADRIDKTRREIQQKIREVRVSKHGGSALTEVSALE